MLYTLNLLKVAIITKQKQKTPLPISSSNFLFLTPSITWLTNLLSVSMDLHILGSSYQWNHTIYGLLCPDPLLTIMFSRFIHVVVCKITLFLLMAK